ncbi:MAG: hypothetical protein ACLTBV_16990 [Enterocloster bolteae]
MLDLLIKNGHVIDPANRTDQVGNIAIYNGRITRYEEGEPARHVVDAAGRYVFPGLIDAHAHMFQEGTEIGIYPDVAYLPTRSYVCHRFFGRRCQLSNLQVGSDCQEQGLPSRASFRCVPQG